MQVYALSKTESKALSIYKSQASNWLYADKFYGSVETGWTSGNPRYSKLANNAKWAGRLLGAYSALRTIDQRINGEIGTGWMIAELGTTTVSVFGGIYGAAWGFGWEAGRFITTLESYQEFKYNFWNNH